MLTLQFIPYHEIEDLDSQKRISKLLKAVRSNKIILLEGRLRTEEEAELIKKTMEEISKEFKGIELSVIDPANTDANFLKKIKAMLAHLLLGGRHGLTIIGPASIIKEIRQDPDKIQLLTEEASSGKRRK